ncbi:uncharacterized protein LOC111284811 isoform X3 [Durio zibethinus]|uniref:ubiquitinyl hydrolase 1 n=1 Tax=Durio zibethinus TaxID=66656 RepID=A0A6P5XNM0_DURZI|nr:uncharacterized protein LOC111284811 isoform X3 [Durio zibethinus]
MTRILIQRGSTGSSSSNPSRSSSVPGPSSSRAEPQVSSHQVPSAAKDEEVSEELQEQVASDELLECARSSENKAVKSDDPLPENLHNDRNETSSDSIAQAEKLNTLDASSAWDMMNDLGGLRILEKVAAETVGASSDPLPIGSGSLNPPPPPVPPPKPSSANSNSRRFVLGSSNTVRAGSSRRAVAWPIVSTRTSPSGSRPSSPRSHGESEGYNSADEQNSCFVSSYDDAERERQFEIDIRRAKGLEVKRMLEDGNCLFRAVADQVYGDSEAYDLIRQMCIDYMERERDHFSQFITEGFTSYCKRKRRDKANVDKDQVKAAIKAQQDQQIDNALLAEGRFYSDLELTEKEIERMVMEASRAEYLANNKFKPQVGRKESSTSTAEPSSSGARRPSGSETKVEGWKEHGMRDTVLSSGMQILLSMGFSYLQAIEAYNIFGDDVDSMVCYLVETKSSSRRKGKATQQNESAD